MDLPNVIFILTDILTGKLFIGLIKSVLSPQNWVDLFDNSQTLFIIIHPIDLVNHKQMFKLFNLFGANIGVYFSSFTTVIT